MSEEITVFTPTYNRKRLLKRAYMSLRKQTNHNFIWLVIDDGSTDHTQQDVLKWQLESPFIIEYHSQKNMGKHVAYNVAIEKCKTPYFLFLDSDDVLDKKCIEILIKMGGQIKDSPTVSGVIGNRFRLSNRTVIGTRIPKNIGYASGIELYQKYKFKGDTLRFYKTSILKQFLFPTFDGETFMAENVLFDKVDIKYKMLLTSAQLYYSDYLDDGYSKNIDMIRVKNPVGYALSLKSSAETAIVTSKKINWTLLYLMWCRHFHIKPGYKEYSPMLLSILMYPAAHILYYIKYPRFFFNGIKGLKTDVANK